MRLDNDAWDYSISSTTSFCELQWVSGIKLPLEFYSRLQLKSIINLYYGHENNNFGRTWGAVKITIFEDQENKINVEY